MNKFLQAAQRCAEVYPFMIMADAKVNPAEITPELQARLRKHKQALTEEVHGQHFLIEPDALFLLCLLGKQYKDTKQPDEQHQIVLPFPRMVLNCVSPDGEFSRIYLVHQRGMTLKFEPMAIAPDFLKLATSVRLWDLETDEEETFYTATRDLWAMTQPQVSLDIQEQEDDATTEVAKLMTIGLCLHLDNPRYVRAERQDGTYTRQQRRLAERKGQPLPAVSTIRIELTEEGATRVDEAGRMQSLMGTVRQPPRRHHVRAHMVRRRNGTTYLRHAFVRGHGDLIEQTRCVVR
jgi:hypothetical protein